MLTLATFLWVHLGYRCKRRRRMHMLHVPQRQGIRIPHLHKSGLYTVTSFFTEAEEGRGNVQPHDVHRESHCGRLSNSDVNPCSLAGASEGSSNGMFRSAIITIEQYAPLYLDEPWLISLRFGIKYLASTSPPTETANPPSICLVLPSHFHLEIHRQHLVLRG